jgi:hypothetical protein
MFVALFREFLELHGEEYRAVNSDDEPTIRGMQRKFDGWLRAMQEA